MMNGTYYLGHDLKWTQRFIDALPKKKGLDYAKAVCIAITLQHKYTLEKKREVILNHSLLKDFGINEKNLEKYLPYFVKAGLIEWVRKKGTAPKIVLVTLPPSYMLNKKKENKKNIMIKETSETVSQVTSETVSQVTSETVSQVKKLNNADKVNKKERNKKKGYKEGMQGRYTKEKYKGYKEGIQGFNTKKVCKGGKH